MRTLAARATARRVYADVIRATLSARAAADPPRMLIAALASRPGWGRQDGQNIVHAFGSRQSAIMIPARADARAVAALVIRAELNALLGDCEWPLLSAFQDLAARELEHLSAAIVSSR